MSDEVDRIAVANYVCPYCNAGMGHWCRTKSGKHATFLHSGRTWPLQMAWGEGYGESEKYVQESLTRRLDAIRERMRRHGVDEQAIEEILQGLDRKWF